MMKPNTDGDNYVRSMLYVFFAFASFIVAILTGYFGGVGLYFGQGVVEGDVWQDYKYPCTNKSKTASECTNFDTNTTTAAYDDYQTFTGELNPLVIRFIQATFVLFSLLTLVFLFLALRSSGLLKGNKETKDMRDQF